MFWTNPPVNIFVAAAELAVLYERASDSTRQENLLHVLMLDHLHELLGLGRII